MQIVKALIPGFFDRTAKVLPGIFQATRESTSNLFLKAMCVHIKTYNPFYRDDTRLNLKNIHEFKHYFEWE